MALGMAGESDHSTPTAKPVTWASYSPTSSIRHLTKLPTFRDSLLYGIGAGSVVGFLRYVRKPNVLSACNWAVGTFLGVSTVAWYRCNALQLEKDMKVQHAVDLMNRREQKKAALKQQQQSQQHQQQALEHETEAVEKKA